MPTMPKIPLEKGDRWMEATEVAELFGVSPETVNRWAREGLLTGYRPSKRSQFFKKSNVNQLLKKRNLPLI